MTFGSGWLFGVLCGIGIVALFISISIVVELIAEKIWEMVSNE